ncbi:MAG: RNA polymerase sigma factor [Planctomycetes bacterium]|nr:RNA polymerase sigma factor [Planctomycetota bacterium]
MTALPATEEALLARAAAGDREAFRPLVDAHYGRIHAFVSRDLGDPDDAREVCQEAFLSAWRAAGSYRGEAGVGTWLARIAVNRMRSRLRGRLPSGAGGDPDGAGLDGFAAHVRNSADEAAGREDADRVRTALGHLPPEQREALVMRHYGGYGFGEISRVLGIPEATVKSRVRYGLLKIEEMLREGGVR